MDTFLSKTISDVVNQVIKENEESFAHTLCHGLNPNEPIDKSTLILVKNAIEFSSVLSIGIVLEYLTESGLVHLDEDLLRRQLLKPVEPVE